MAFSFLFFFLKHYANSHHFWKDQQDYSLLGFWLTRAVWCLWRYKTTFSCFTASFLRVMYEFCDSLKISDSFCLNIQYSSDSFSFWVIFTYPIHYNLKLLLHLFNSKEVPLNGQFGTFLTVRLKLCTCHCRKCFGSVRDPKVSYAVWHNKNTIKIKWSVCISWGSQQQHIL